MHRLCASKEILAITRLPIANIARLVRFPTFNHERERLNKLRHFLLRRPDLSEWDLELGTRVSTGQPDDDSNKWERSTWILPLL